MPAGVDGMAGEQAGAPRAREIAALIACLAAGIALNLRAIGGEAAWCDEALTAACHPADSLAAYLACAFERDPTIRLAPLYHLVQYNWSALFGGSLLSLRALSVTLSALAMLQLYAFARQIASPAVARLAILIASASVFQVYFAQEVRVYALLNLVALCAMAAFRAAARGGSGRALAWNALLNAMLLLTHSFAVLLVATQGILIALGLAPRRRALRWLGVHLLLGAAYPFWLWAIGYDFGGQTLAYNDRPAGMPELGVAALQFAGGRFSKWNPAPGLPGGINLEWVLLALAGALVAWGLWARSRRPDAWILLAWMVLPVLLLFAAAYVWRPCFFPRYVLFCAAPLALMLALALCAIPRAALRRVALAALLGLMLWQNLAFQRPFRPDYTAAARIVEAQTSDHAVVLAMKPFNYIAAEYAFRNAPVTVERHYGMRETVAAAIAHARAGTAVWAVFHQWDDPGAFEDPVAGAGLIARRTTLGGAPPLDLYEIRRP
ncbi:MAG: glycosyltransferase family 39 protein [Candidatus Hydrogenedentes bacterium]|nr:glycosyltransferase family 39 protein [Candidatus Hydrogenedentota bacterium]